MVHSVLLVNALVWQWDCSSECPKSINGSAVPHSFVCIRDDIFEEIGDMVNVPSRDLFDSVIDVNGQLVLPGLIGKQ